MSDGDHRRDAVRLQQAADDVGFDRRRRAEDDGEFTHSAAWPPGHAAPAPAERLVDFQQDHRHIVMLVRVADKRLDLAQDPLREFGGVEMAVLLDDVAETASPNRSLSASIASVMPSVYSTTTSPALSSMRVPRATHRTFSEAPGMRRPRTMPSGVRICAPRGCGRRRPRQKDQRRVSGAAVGHRSRACDRSPRKSS